MMIDYDSRFLDLELSEELGGDTPPDLTDSIVKAARARQSARRAATMRPPGRRTFGRGLAPWASVVAISAVVILAFVFWFSNRDRGRNPPGTEGPGSVRLANAGLYVPDVSSASELWGRPVLQNGWLYADGSVSEILAGVQLIRFNHARAVVKLGDVPNVYEAARMKWLLQQSHHVSSTEELEMLFDRSKWTTGMGLALCLFAGEAFMSDTAVRADDGAAEITVDDVFNRFDLDKSGSLEAKECVCECSKACDADQDGTVTRKEFHEHVLRLPGSGRQLIETVQRHGGLDKFYELAAAGKLQLPSEPVTMKAVFAFLDKDKSGVLEPQECICQGSKNADLNQDGKVTPKELAKVATEHFGSTEKFLEIVAAHGGIAEFFAHATGGDAAHAAAGDLTVDAVFRCYDLDRSGVLEAGECVCHGTKNADFDKNGTVTAEEFTKVVRKLFGTDESFLEHVRACGGAEKFYAMVTSKDGK